jgi:hypothetical protein
LCQEAVFLPRIFDNIKSTKAFVHIGILYKKVKIKSGINQLALVLPSKNAPVPTSKNGAEFPTKL